MKQIDWVEELEKRKKKEEFKNKYWRDQEGKLRYSTVHKTIWFDYATGGAATPGYKTYYWNTTA